MSARSVPRLVLALLVVLACAVPPPAAGAGGGLLRLPDPTPAEAALDRLVTVEFADRWLEGALADLARDAAVPIDVDWAAVAAGGLRRDDRVTLRLRAKPLRVVLRHLLRSPNPNAVTVVAGDRRLRVVAGETSARRLTADYDVRDLLPEGARRPPDVRPARDGELEQFLIGLFRYEGWADEGVQDGSTLRVLPGRVLRVRGTRALHHRLRWLLPALAEPGRRQPVVPFAPASPAARRRVLAALASPSRPVAGGRTTVGDVLRRVASASGVDVVLRRDTGDDDGRPQRARIDLPDNLSSAQALAAAAKAATTEVYAVGYVVDNYGIVSFGRTDLLGDDGEAGELFGVYDLSSAADDEARLRVREDLVGSAVPEAWRENGGSSAVAAVWGRALVVVSNRRAFDAIDPVARRLTHRGAATTRPATN